MYKASRCTVVLGGLLAFIVGCQQPLKVGSVAPDFTGATDEGKTVKLSSLMGKNGSVVYFYPKDETPGCITEACSFRDRLGKLQGKGYQVIGISCDSVDSHKTFKAHHKLPFTLIADEDGTIARQFGVPLAKKTLGGEASLLVDRQTFVLDKDRKVLRHIEVEDPEAHVRATYETLAIPFY